jgi:hypothetical protein
VTAQSDNPRVLTEFLDDIASKQGTGVRNFLGTDGSVFVFEVTNRSAGTLAMARDRNTCEALWTLPTQVDSLARIWRINATLVQLSDDGTELMSLVAPS